MDTIKLEIKYTNDANEIYLDNENVSERIREDDISKLSSKIAVIGFVREKMVHLQRKLGEQGQVILDGRDIGTVVFPNADFKFFMKADPKVRAQRRWEELSAKGIEVSLNEVEKDIIWRDKNDSNRTNAPLKKADDAIEIDTSKLSIDDQVKRLQSIIENGA
jgi:cytidylate kinase